MGPETLIGTALGHFTGRLGTGTILALGGLGVAWWLYQRRRAANRVLRVRGHR